MPRGYRMGLLLLGDSPSVPNGSTVTPINDVPTWLQCAGIPTTTYTTLSEVLADTSLLRVLINSENAMDYLVRCKEWIKQKALVPAMTSNTTPSGVASNDVTADNNHNGNAYLVFDNNTSTSANFYNSNGQVGWFQYEFDTPVVAGVLDYTNGQSKSCTSYKLQGSNDGNLFADIATISDGISDTTQTIKTVLNNTTAYKYYRFVFTPKYCPANGYYYAMVNELQLHSKEGIADSQTAMQLIGANDYASYLLLSDEDWLEGICNSEYMSYLLNLQVPAMTSNNTPSGECSASGSTSSSYPAYFAFDGDDSTYWYHYGGTLPTGWDYRGIQYDFGKQTRIYVADIKKMNGAGSSAQNYSTAIAGSDDGINAVLLTAVDSVNLIGGTLKSKRYKINGNYKYYRLYSDSSVLNSSALIFTLQFYGRQFGGVQSWLLAAGITNKNYTTLNQVLADTDTLTALISSHSAMDYLVICTSWANDICSNQTAMELIGNDNYASNKLLADSTWLNAICNSTYFESVLNVKVPVMTSNTTPEGLCIGDATNGTYNYSAFDGNDSSRTYVTNQIGKTIGYQFTSGCKVKKVFLKPYWNGDTYNVEGSNDGDTWDNIGSIIGNMSGSTAVVNAMIDYTYYRFNQSTRISSNNLQEFLTAQFYGRQDVA